MHQDLETEVGKKHSARTRVGGGSYPENKINKSKTTKKNEKSKRNRFLSKQKERVVGWGNGNLNGL